ncbi:unnamed protein product [Schistosoma turkestanicum]|nr:unnamed protein product [Schistosoma turkestanicum]
MSACSKPIEPFEPLELREIGYWKHDLHIFKFSEILMRYLSLLFFLLLYSQCKVGYLAVGDPSDLKNVAESVIDKSKSHDTKNSVNSNEEGVQIDRNYETPTNSIDEEKVGISSHQVSSEPLDSPNSQKSYGEGSTPEDSVSHPTHRDSAKPDHEVVRESILKELHSLDSVAVEGINTHEIPTFNEFHAMVSEGSQSRKGQENKQKNDPTVLNTSDTATTTTPTPTTTNNDTTEFMEGNNPTQIDNVSPSNFDEINKNNSNNQTDHNTMVDQLFNRDLMNNDSPPVDSSASKSHSDDTISSSLSHGENVNKQSEEEDLEILHHRHHHHDKFCDKIDPVKLLHEPFCPAGSILDPSVNHHHHDTPSDCPNAKVATNNHSPPTTRTTTTTTTLHQSHFHHTPPHVNYNHNTPVETFTIDQIPQNVSATTHNVSGTSSQSLHNESFRRLTTNEMSLFSRLKNAIKHTVFSTFSQWFSSTQDIPNESNLILQNIKPTAENFHTIQYLFHPNGFTNPLCKNSLLYVTINQIQGLWHLRQCLSLLLLTTTTTTSTVEEDSQSTVHFHIHPLRIQACVHAIEQLNLTLITTQLNNVPPSLKHSIHDHWSVLYEFDKSIGHLFVAYAMMLKHNRTLLLQPSSASSASTSSLSCRQFTSSFSTLYDIHGCCECFNWDWRKLNIFLWNNTMNDHDDKCFKLPSFLFPPKRMESSSPASSPSPSSSYQQCHDPIDSPSPLNHRINDQLFMKHDDDDDQYSMNHLIQHEHTQSPSPSPSSSSPSSSSSSSSSSASSSTKSSFIKSHRINNDSPYPTGHNNEALVVPAGLSGSQRSNAYMRLNNRVRIIERNVSVSMRYLEELSQSYRRQMERLSRSFNLTYAWLKVTTQTAEQRNHEQQNRITQLELKLNDLTERLKSRLFNALPTAASTTTTTTSSLTSNQPDLALTSSLSQSATGTTFGSSGGGVTETTSSNSPPPPLPDFDNSLDWNPWFRSSPDDSMSSSSSSSSGKDDFVDDGDMEFVSVNDDDDDADADDDHVHYVTKLPLAVRNSRGKFKQTLTTHTTTTSSSINSKNKKSPLDPYLSTRMNRHQQQHQPTEWLSSLSAFLLDWKQCLLNWFRLQLVWPVWLSNIGTVVRDFYQMNTTIFNLLSLILLHIILALIVHLSIYWIWFRPHTAPHHHQHQLIMNKELLLLSTNLYQLLYCFKNHQHFNDFIVYFNSIHAAEHHHHHHREQPQQQHQKYLLPATINTTDNTTNNTTTSNYNNHDSENTPATTPSSHSPTPTPPLPPAPLTSTTTNYTTDNDNSSNNDNNHNNKSNSNNNNKQLVSKTFPCCHQFNELLLHTSKCKSAMEINCCHYHHHDHHCHRLHHSASPPPVCPLKEIDGNVSMPIGSCKLMNPVNYSCCLLTKPMHIDKIVDDNYTSSSQVGCYAQPKHLTSSLQQLPTIYSSSSLSSDNNQYKRDTVKYEDNDCLQSCVSQSHELMLSQGYNVPQSLNNNDNNLLRRKPDHLTSSIPLTTTNSNSSSSASSSSSLSSSTTTSTLIQKKHSKSNNHHQHHHQRKKLNKRKFENNRFV